MLSTLLRILNSLTSRILPHLPGPWRLPILTRMLKWTTNDEREAFHLPQIGPCKGHAIDIGANYGLYSHGLQRHYDSVTAFEPNTAIATPLIAAAYPNVRIVHEALSSHSGTAILHIPKQNGVILSGWASLEPEVATEAQSLIDIEVPISTLDSHHLQNVGFIKIDVEGHELEVLLGAEQTIRQSKPHLLIEIQDKHLPTLRSLLTTWGYTETTLSKIGGPNGSPQNYIFIPTPTSL
jgi:FkbM family methyltransferase